MISTEVKDNRVLVIAQGSINLVVEQLTERKRLRPALRKHMAVIAVGSLSGALAAVLITLFLASQIRGAMEDRLSARIAQVDDHLNAVAANVGARSERQSDSLITHLNQIGSHIEHVGQQVQDIGDSVDALPTTIQRANDSSTKSLVSWLSTLRSPARAKPPSLTVHGPDRGHNNYP